jgi:hypothetical protein
MLNDLYGFVNRSDVPHVAGVPRFLYRQFAVQVLQWSRTWLARDPLERWVEQLYTIRFFGLIWERWRLWLRQPTRRLFERRALIEITSATVAPGA